MCKAYAKKTGLYGSANKAMDIICFSAEQSSFQAFISIIFPGCDNPVAQEMCKHTKYACIWVYGSVNRM
jgi:hypothetical protein